MPADPEPHIRGRDHDDRPNPITAKTKVVKNYRDHDEARGDLHYARHDSKDRILPDRRRHVAVGRHKVLIWRVRHRNR